LFLSQTQEHRKSYRLKFTNPVLFQSLNERDFGGSIGCDISEGGVKLNLAQFIPVGTELSLQIEFSKDNVCHCTGRVMWVEVLPMVERYRVGIEFDSVDSPVEFKKELQHRVKLASI
jgi:hypothetical protein